eukprot:15466322-Alexandrium_andersonii.AAC.1
MRPRSRRPQSDVPHVHGRLTGRPREPLFPSRPPWTKSFLRGCRRRQPTRSAAPGICVCLAWACAPGGRTR